MAVLQDNSSKINISSNITENAGVANVNSANFLLNDNIGVDANASSMITMFGLSQYTSALSCSPKETTLINGTLDLNI
jgi:hypothetical protein